MNDNNLSKQDLQQLEAQLAELNQKYEECSNALKASNVMVRRLKDNYVALEQEHNKILRSRGWRILHLFYRVQNKLLPVGSRRFRAARAVAKFLLSPVWFLLSKLKKKNFSAQGAFLSADMAFEKLKDCERIDIVVIEHTLYVAELLQGILLSAGIQCEIHLNEPKEYENIPYIMICPQNFKRFPQLYIAFQMEQTINPRWLTDEYINILHNAYAVFDYSMVNIEYFSNDPVLAGKLYYMPIDVCDHYIKDNKPSEEKEYDVLFYGSPFVDRRQSFLKPIGEKYNLKVICDKFGEELYKEMRKAKIVINAHYYENALLETTRLYETLSVSDCLIISEKSGDKKEELALENIVDFTSVGNINQALERIDYWLSHEEERKAKVEENLKTLSTRANATKFYLYRFLLANDRIAFDDFYSSVGKFINFTSNRVCLSLPESISRKKAFEEDNKYGFEFFPGLKHRIGWIGCGMSYKFMLKKAAEQNFDNVLICEDDVYFPPEFEEKFYQVLEYTKNNSDWNIFSGIMADVGRVKILKHVQQNGVDFVYLDKIISMVFNLYDKSAFNIIADWDELNRNVHVNAIDRYLENSKLRVLTTCPFLVGHKEDLNSTIWGQQNTIYTQLIADSSKKLQEMTDEYIKSSKKTK